MLEERQVGWQQVALRLQEVAQVARVLLALRPPEVPLGALPVVLALSVVSLWAAIMAVLEQQASEHRLLAPVSLERAVANFPWIEPVSPGQAVLSCRSIGQALP